MFLPVTFGIVLVLPWLVIQFKETRKRKSTINNATNANKIFTQSGLFVMNENTFYGLVYNGVLFYGTSSCSLVIIVASHTSAVEILKQQFYS
jgi:hypothetical protein